MSCHHLPLGNDQQDQLQKAASLLAPQQRNNFRLSVRNELSDGNSPITNQSLRRTIRFVLSAYGVSTKYLNLKEIRRSENETKTI